MVKLCNYDEQIHYMLQKTPSHSRDAFSIWEGVAFFYVSSLLRTSAHRPLRLDFLVLEVFEVCVALY